MAFLWSVLYVIAIGIASHFIGEAVPRDRFDAKSAGCGQVPFRSAP